MWIKKSVFYSLLPPPPDPLKMHIWICLMIQDRICTTIRCSFDIASRSYFFICKQSLSYCFYLTDSNYVEISVWLDKNKNNQATRQEVRGLGIFDEVYKSKSLPSLYQKNNTSKKAITKPGISKHFSSRSPTHPWTKLISRCLKKCFF